MNSSDNYFNQSSTIYSVMDTSVLQKILDKKIQLYKKKKLKARELGKTKRMKRFQNLQCPPTAGN